MNQIAIPLRDGVKLLSQIPWAFDSLRWILEGGFRQHRELLASHFPQPPRRVLDCGCGTGIHSSFFPSHAYEGVDISPIYIDRAQACFPKHRFRVMDATQLEFHDNTFDAVIVSGVIHHLNPATALEVIKEISRVLLPGGILLLWEDVPTRHSMNLVGRIVHSLDVGEHIRPENEYERLLSNHFCVESTETICSGFMDYVAFKARNRLKLNAVSNRRALTENVSQEPASDSTFIGTESDRRSDQAFAN